MSSIPHELDPESAALLEAWWEAHGTTLLAFARRRLADGESAEDVVQEALLSAAEALRRGDRPGNERAFLFTLLRRRIVDFLRRRTRTKRVEEDLADILREPTTQFRDGIYAVAIEPWPAPPEAAMQRAEFWSAFHACVEQMPDLMRQAILLREIDGEPTDSVCQTLEITKANLWTLIHRARLRLREALTPMVREETGSVRSAPAGRPQR